MSKDFEAMKTGKSAIWPKSSPNLNSCSIKTPPAGLLYNDFGFLACLLAYLLVVCIPYKQRNARLMHQDDDGWMLQGYYELAFYFDVTKIEKEIDILMNES